MRISRRGKFMLAVMAGLTTILLAPQAAFAAYYGGEINYAAHTSWPDDGAIGLYVSTTGAGVKFYSDGDVFYVRDLAADGHSAALIWFDADSARSGSCISQWGNGNTGYCDKDFTEGHRIYYAAAVYEAGSLVRNSEWIWNVA